MRLHFGFHVFATLAIALLGCGGGGSDSGDTQGSGGSTGAHTSHNGSGGDASTSTSGGTGGSGTGGGGATGGGATTGTGGSGPEDPVVEIYHPGDGETRDVGSTFPCSGNADDPQDGLLGDGSVVWVSDVEGELSTLLAFDWTPQQPGTQVLTLTATDSDGNTGSDSITLNFVEP